MSSLHPKYRPDIDGLRAIAVLAVLAFHAFPNQVRGGFIGVDVFFVISGYLISTIIFESLDKGNFSFLEFYARRIRRIFPALILVLITSFIFGWFILLANDFKQLGKHIAASAGFIPNIVFWKEAGYFDNAADTKPLIHLWSLGIEEQFYIIWPLIIWYAWKRKFNLLLISIVITISSFILNLKGIKQDSVATFYSPQTRFWELLSGSLLAWLTLHKKGTFSNIKTKVNLWLHHISYEKQKSDTLANLLSFVGLLFLVWGFWRIKKDLSFPGTWALVPIFGAILIITAGSKAWINRKILSNKIIVWFGLISFPLYLWHWPLLSFARIIGGEIPSHQIRIASLLLSTMLAWLTYKLVERPIRFSKQGKSKVPILVLLMIGVGFVGQGTYSFDGLKFRSITKSTFQFRHNLVDEGWRLRNIEIRRGVCHVNKNFTDIDSFVSNWRCFPDKSDPQGKKILIFGDSNAADKAMSLRSNKVDVGQLGGAGCSINPALANDKRDYCINLFKLAKRYEDKFDIIILSNRFPIEQINEKNLSEIFRHWSGSKQVYLFTPMPDFSSQMNEFLKAGKINSPPDFSGEDAFLDLLNKADIPANFKIINTSDLWCVNRASNKDFPCSVAINNELLMLDGNHLSTSGAKIFGNNMISHPLLKPLFSD